MTKNTTRKRKRKNLKLRRTIRKTVAALIMIMAVIVAGLPVENFGTMQAKTTTVTDIPISQMYTTYATAMEDSDTEDKLVGRGSGIVSDATDFSAGDSSNSNTYTHKTLKVLEQSNGTYLDWEFMVKERTSGSNEMVINGFSRSRSFGDNITIDEELCTEYLVVTQDHEDKLKSELAGENYVITFGEETGNASYTIPAGQVDSSYTQINGSLPKINIDNMSDSNSIYVNTTTFTDANGKSCKISGKSDAFNAQVIFDEINSGALQTAKDRIAEYNTAVDAFFANLETAKRNAGNNNYILDSDYATLKAKANELGTLYTELKNFKLECSFRELQDNDKFIKLCLEKRLSINEFALEGFDLIALSSNTSVEGKYLPHWEKKSASSTSLFEDLKAYDNKDEKRANRLDESGYVGLKYVKVSGIGNSAFAGCETIKYVSLPKTINFIGNDAFNGCRNLKSIDLKNVMVIGNRAFKECTALETVVFSDSISASSETRILGAEAFYHTTSLLNVSFPGTIQAIGRGCFATSGLAGFTIQQNNDSDIVIWPFAFYDCTSLGNTGDGTTSGSFFPDKDFKKKITIGMGAFAVSNSSGTMTEFCFPNSMTKIMNGNGDQFKIKESLGTLFQNAGKTITEEASYDYILAGRYKLNKVVFPYNLGTDGKTKIPDNTLKGCKDLGCVVFGALCYSGTNAETTYDVWAPDGAKKTDYDEDGDDEVLFQDITNVNFYVEGPGYINANTSTNKADPRTITAKAQTAVSDNVPYMFLESDNPPEVRIEISYGDDNECLAVLEVTSDDGTTKTVKLIEYVYTGDGNKMIKDLVIKSMIGNYRLTELGEGCFIPVKDKVLELIIEDGSITNIEADAFRGSTSLQKVTIGNSVKSIGAGAFAGCKALENVYFSSPKAVNSINDSSVDSEWASVLTIGEDAFKTTSEYLTFHGDIHSGYAPFELAMSGKSFGSSASKRTICYKTDAPQNLTVVYDHDHKVSTLIDYPHYEEIDKMNADIIERVVQSRTDLSVNTYSITDNFEAYNNWKTIDKYKAAAPNSEEAAVIAATYDIELPNGIQSIDVKNYISYSDNSDNKDYLYLSYKEAESTGEYKRNKDSRVLNGSHDIIKVYSDDNTGSGSDVTKAGLFSGYYLEAGTGIVPGADTEKTFNGRTMRKEDVTSGNDQLLEVYLNTVEYLPDYAFESCENLNSVGLGTKLSTFGNAPFRGCGNLTNIDTADNPYFTCESGLIYHLPSASSESDLGTGYVIEECLEPRGDVIGYKSINSTTDSLISKVTGVKPEAFSYCPNLQTIDLSDTSITVIPEECFRGSGSLMEVVLPESVSRIDSKAFSETSPKVTIYSTTCQIESDAFDDGSGIIRGYMYADGSETKYSTAYQYAKNHNIQFEEITAKYTLTFLDYDGSLIETQQVEQGKDGVAPNWTSTRTGYTFKEWSWEQKTSNGTQIVTGEKAYRNVTENRIILATYTVGSGVVSDGKDYTLNITDGKNIAGNTKITLKGGTAVSIIADTKSGSSFQYWSESTGKYNEMFEDIHTAVTTFIMPNADVTIQANYTSGTGNGTGSGSNSTDSETTYKLTVNYGSGTGEYKAGEVVSISAYAPESSSKVFSKWTSATTGVGFANATSSTTTITMPASAVTVTANYKTRTADDEEDDEESEALNKRKENSTTATVTTGTNNATITTTTGTVTNTNPSVSTGDSITINKNGISNTNVASTNVEGAADNFVVKVSDSASAVTEAEEALKNKYGSLDGILYFPMDISLYDETGKNQITDTTGLNVTVTIPIPDELIQYGGNVRAAAIENGQLQDLTVRFTTIDGIACMSFVPPHFSPYVIYVDTNNLVAGQMLDATPKTGDPIHPKWFLAMGMACLSVILFTTGDKKKKIKMA